MADRIDKIDYRILQILQTNSKITNLELSKRIGLSPAPTLERVKKLENSGVIESYHAKVNPQSLELINELDRLSFSGCNQAESVNDRSQQVLWLTTAYSVARRVAVWRPVHQLSVTSDHYPQFTISPLAVRDSIKMIRSFFRLAQSLGRLNESRQEFATDMKWHFFDIGSLAFPKELITGVCLLP